MKKQSRPAFPVHTPSDYPSPVIRRLYRAILSIKNEKEAQNFFRDLLTIPEITEFANRWEMVTLIRNRVPYAAIAKKLGVSTTTVTRTAYWLKHGTGGYRTIAERVKT